MRWMSLNKATGAVAIAALLVGGTVSAGAYTGIPSIPSVPDSTSFPYEAFAGFGDFVNQQIAQAVEQHMAAKASASTGGSSASVDVSGPAVAAVMDQVTKALENAQSSQSTPSVPSLPDLGSIASDTQQQAAATPPTTVQDLVDLLLGMVDAVDTSVNPMLDTAEAALIAKIEEARTTAHTELTNGGMTQLIPFVDTELDLAIQLVHQAFATIRTQLSAGLDEIRNRITEEVAGIDLGQNLDQVLAQLQALRAEVDQALAAATSALNDALAGIGV